MKNLSKHLASVAATFVDTEGGSQCPARVRFQGKYIPIEKVIDITKENDFILILLFHTKQFRGTILN